MSDNIKKIAVSGSAIAMAIAMGLQTFVFGHNDIQDLKDKMEQIAKRVAHLEATQPHD